MLPLPNYFNPRISRETRDRYITYIVPVETVRQTRVVSVIKDC